MFRNKKEFYNSDEFAACKNEAIEERKHSDGLVYCEHCGKPILKKYDLIAHHRKELTDQNVNDYMISLNKEMIKLVHFKCHNEIHKRFGKERMKKVYIVYGPPCGGKSTFVYDNAGPNDLIVDMDSIYQMISINDRYIKPDRLKLNAFALRDNLYDQIKCRVGKWENAYVIAGLPMLMERQRLSQKLDGELIYIDCDITTCKARAIERLNYTDTLKYIDDWFRLYTE